MKYQKQFTDKNTKFSENVYNVTHGSRDIFNYHYEIFICEIYLRNLHVKFTSLCTYLMHGSHNIEFTVLYDSVSHDESNA